MGFYGIINSIPWSHSSMLYVVQEFDRVNFFIKAFYSIIDPRS